MVSVSHASRTKGIFASHLSEIWRIDLDSTKQTLEVTSKHSTGTNNPTLSRNFGTNNRMLQYKINEVTFIHEYLIFNKDDGKVFTSQHMLPNIRSRKGLCLGCPHEK